MGKNARKRVEDALPLAIDGRMDKAQAAVVTADLFAADPQLEADIELGAALRDTVCPHGNHLIPGCRHYIELGAALNSDKAERVLADVMAGLGWAFDEPFPNEVRAILAALRKGLAEKVQ